MRLSYLFDEVSPTTDYRIKKLSKNLETASEGCVNNELKKTMELMQELLGNEVVIKEDRIEYN